jgi:hypothetical protein
MNKLELLKSIKAQLQSSAFIEFHEALFSLSQEDIRQLKNNDKGAVLVRLPQSEISFYDWLKKEAFPIWKDLWQEDDLQLYTISIDLLPALLKTNNTFPICDLVSADNYFFTSKMIKPLGWAQMDVITQKIKNSGSGKLLPEEGLLFSISQHPTDIWHFCYQNNLPLNKAHKIVEEAVYNGWLVHLPNSDDLLTYIDF